MSDTGSDNEGGNRTVFRPSPLQQRGQTIFNPGPAPDAATAPTQPFGQPSAPAAPPSAPRRLREDDVPAPATKQVVGNRLVAGAAPILALVAGMRTGRVRIAIADLHRQVSGAIAEFDSNVLAEFPEETRQQAKYALCATADDIVQNLPGADGAAWAPLARHVSVFTVNRGVVLEDSSSASFTS